MRSAALKPLKSPGKLPRSVLNEGGYTNDLADLSTEEHGGIESCVPFGKYMVRFNRVVEVRMKGFYRSMLRARCLVCNWIIYAKDLHVRPI